MQVRSIGKRDCGNLFKLGDDMIIFLSLHQLLASSVADMLPVNVSVLLCDEAKKLARQGNSRYTAFSVNMLVDLADRIFYQSRNV